MRFWAIVWVILVACGSSKDPVTAPAINDYFPLGSGLYYIYNVDSTVTDQGIATTYTYDLKLQVIDSFANGEGDYSYVIQRSKKNSGSTVWSSMPSWSARVNLFQAVVNEGNTSFIKIESPLADGKAWNGNALNNIGGDERCLNSSDNDCDIYTIRNFGKPFAINGGLAFQNSMTVEQNDNEDVIVFQDRRSEIYAKKIGMVYREIIQLHYCTDSDCLGQQQVDNGLNYTQTLQSYGGI